MTVIFDEERGKMGATIPEGGGPIQGTPLFQFRPDIEDPFSQSTVPTSDTVKQEQATPKGNAPSWSAMKELVLDRAGRASHAIAGVFSLIVGGLLAPICLPAAITLYATRGAGVAKAKSEADAFNRVMETAQKEHNELLKKLDGARSPDAAKSIITIEQQGIDQQLTQVEPLLKKYPDRASLINLRTRVLEVRKEVISELVIKSGVYLLANEAKNLEDALKKIQKDLEKAVHSAEHRQATHKVARVLLAPFVSALGHFDSAFGPRGVERY